MENRISYTLIGGFFLFCTILMALFIWWIGRYGESKEAYRPYYILAQELDSGIKQRTPVRFRGINVGFVQDFRFSKEHQEMVEIELWIQKEIPIRRDSYAVVEAQGLSGLSYIAIKQKSTNAPLFDPSERAELPLGATLLERVSGGAEQLAQSTQSALERFNELLKEENIQRIDSILGSTDVLLAHLARSSSQLQTLLNTSELMAESGTRAFKMLENVTKELRGIGEVKEELKSTLMPLLRQSEVLLNETESAISEGKELINELKTSPYNFLFDEKISPKGPGE
ncbi:MAG: MlaD family protein [Wolinella sp.]